MAKEECKSVLHSLELKCSQEDGHEAENGEPSRHWAGKRMENDGKQVWVTVEWE